MAICPSLALPYTPAVSSPSLVWGLLIYAWVANYMIRMALSSLLPPIMTELGVSYTRADFLATAFFYAYMAMQLPAGFFGDRRGFPSQAPGSARPSA